MLARPPWLQVTGPYPCAATFLLEATKLMHARDDMDTRYSTTVDHHTNHREDRPIEEDEIDYHNYRRPVDDSEVLKVSAHSRPSAVAGAIAGVIRSQGRADVQAIGAGATNQAIKAAAIARDYLQPNGLDIVIVPAFIDVQIADEERTAIRLVIEARPI